MNEQHKPSSLLQIPHYRILALVLLATVIAAAALAVVIFKLDPYSSPDLALPLFFISTLVALTGVFTIVLFFIKKWKSQDHIYVKHVTISLRQGILLSICTSICLALLMLGLLRVWNGLLIVVTMTLVEFYLSAKDELN